MVDTVQTAVRTQTDLIVSDVSISSIGDLSPDDANTALAILSVG